MKYNIGEIVYINTEKLGISYSVLWDMGGIDSFNNNYIKHGSTLVKKDTTGIVRNRKNTFKGNIYLVEYLDLNNLNVCISFKEENLKSVQSSGLSLLNLL